jgi:hypothetical protein
MKNSYYFISVIISIILLSYIIVPVKALNDPVPHVTASIYYPDTCNPEFRVDFEISNLGAPSSADSYLSLSLSTNLDFINWHTTPQVADMMIRIFEIGDPLTNMSGFPISTENLIVEVYNHSFDTAESVTISMFFELTLYQSYLESINYNLVMYPKSISSESVLPIVTDPAFSSTKNQQGYPVYELRIPINSVTNGSEMEDIDIVPEFPSLIFLVIFLTTTIIITTYKKRMKEKGVII